MSSLEDLEKAVAKRKADDVVDPRLAEGIAQPLKAPPPGRPRRPIDGYDWSAGRTEGIRVDVEWEYRMEIAPCPSFMRPQTYAALLLRLRDKVDETGALRPGAAIDRKDRWIGRHVTLWTSPPKLVSSASASDLVDVALGIAREAKRQGRDLREVALPSKRRLLE